MEYRNSETANSHESHSRFSRAANQSERIPSADGEDTFEIAVQQPEPNGYADCQIRVSSFETVGFGGFAEISELFSISDPSQRSSDSSQSEQSDLETL